MPEADFIGRLGNWEGYAPESVVRFAPGERGPRACAEIVLKPVAGRLMQCDGCGMASDRVHDTEERRVRDLPAFDCDTHLVVHRRRVVCVRCGPRLERLEWLPAYARVTKRLAESVARMCAVLPVKQAAAFYDLKWDAVKAIDKAHLESTLGPVDVSDLEVIAMDEFAINKGHRYATVILDPRTKRVIWVGRGRDRDAVRPFYELLGRERCARIKAAAMDMNASYALELRAHCPNARVVYDLFHVQAKYGREVVDRVRVDEANRLRHDKPARKLIKGAKWLLLRNRDNIERSEDRVRLKELLDANKALMRAYLLKDDLKHLWSFRSEGHARRFWKDWYQRAVRSRIPRLVRFAKNLAQNIEGVLAHCEYPLHTSLLEGVNNKIKVIKRMAYGFRDDAYFFMKIRAAFPGKPG